MSSFYATLDTHFHGCLDVLVETRSSWINQTAQRFFDNAAKRGLSLPLSLYALQHYMHLWSCKVCCLIWPILTINLIIPAGWSPHCPRFFRSNILQVSGGCCVVFLIQMHIVHGKEKTVDPQCWLVKLHRRSSVFCCGQARDHAQGQSSRRRCQCRGGSQQVRGWSMWWLADGWCNW